MSESDLPTLLALASQPVPLDAAFEAELLALLSDEPAAVPTVTIEPRTSEPFVIDLDDRRPQPTAPPERIRWIAGVAASVIIGVMAFVALTADDADDGSPTSADTALCGVDLSYEPTSPWHEAGALTFDQVPVALGDLTLGLFLLEAAVPAAGESTSDEATRLRESVDDVAATLAAQRAQVDSGFLDDARYVLPALSQEIDDLFVAAVAHQRSACEAAEGEDGG